MKVIVTPHASRRIKERCPNISKKQLEKMANRCLRGALNNGVRYKNGVKLELGKTGALGVFTLNPWGGWKLATVYLERVG